MGVRQVRKKITTILWAFGVLGLLIYLFWQSGTHFIDFWEHEVHTGITSAATQVFLPGINQEGQGAKGATGLQKHLAFLLPFLKYNEGEEVQMTVTEDILTYEMILAMQGKDEERQSEDLTDTTVASTTVTQTPEKLDLSIEKLRDYNYLLSKFYTVDSTTTVKDGQLDVDKFLAKDMHIDTQSKGPKILIFHTHSQEAFADSKNGDASTSIVGMGYYLSELLNAKGIETLHHAGVYDLINGKLDRSKAYELSEKGVKEILNQYPSIEVVIDLHRDGVREDLHLVTDIDGKPTGRIMFFNGLSRTKTNGDIAYLYNPYIQDNLAFSFRMQLASESMYPGLARRIYLKGYRYSLHMMPKSLLIEAGAQTNTVAEMRNTMEALSNILYEVLVK